ncbi:MAG: class I SAM-dependent methyltransferase [Planctomycetota bacterium]|jgi:SAM-dependent methyltransferase
MKASQGAADRAPARDEVAQTDIFCSAERYDRSINWDARLRREIPLLAEVFGPPGQGGLLDAGCGTGRQAVAMAKGGYQVTAADASEEMLELARRHAAEGDAGVRFVCCPYARLAENLQPGLDGVYCLGNSLAAAGSAAEIELAIRNFATLLSAGGRLFVQVLNFPPLRDESPCVRGPRFVTVDGIEYVSVRTFHFVADPASGPQGRVEVTNVTLWRDAQWRQQSAVATLYPLTCDELTLWCRAAGLDVMHTFGGYDRARFDLATSSDLLLIAEKAA